MTGAETASIVAFLAAYGLVPLLVWLVIR